jgi:hypothetical protein
MNLYDFIAIAILIIIIIIIYRKNKEHLTASNESIQNIGKIYADASGTVNFNNISTNSIMINGNLYKKQNRTRYIRVGNTFTENTRINKVDYWTLLELQAFDYSGNNVAENKPVTITAGSTHNGTWSKPENITNGMIGGRDNTGIIEAKAFYHGSTGDNELEIDLGREYDLSQIAIFNRSPDDGVFSSTGTISGIGASERLNNTTIQLLDKDKNLVRRIYTGVWYATYSKEYIL